MKAVTELTEKLIWLLMLLLGIIIGWIGKSWGEKKRIAKLIKKTITELTEIFKETLKKDKNEIEEKDKIIEELNEHIEELMNELMKYKGENSLLDSQLNKLPVLKDELNALKSNVQNS